MRMPFGRHRGRDVRDIPEHYLTWALDNCDIGDTLRRAIEEALGLGIDGTSHATNCPPPPAIFEEVVDPWYRALSTRFHPDKRGGSHDVMVAVNAAKDLLITMMRAH